MIYRSTPQNRPKDPDNLTPAAVCSNQPIGLKIRNDMVHASAHGNSDLMGRSYGD
jgi:hypothetical protein